MTLPDPMGEVQCGRLGVGEYRATRGRGEVEERGESQQS